MAEHIQKILYTSNYFLSIVKKRFDQMERNRLLRLEQLWNGWLANNSISSMDEGKSSFAKIFNGFLGFYDFIFFSTTTHQNLYWYGFGLVCCWDFHRCSSTRSVRRAFVVFNSFITLLISVKIQNTKFTSMLPLLNRNFGWICFGNIPTRFVHTNCSMRWS